MTQLTAMPETGMGILMALHVLKRVPWDLFVQLCRADGYTNMPMGYFEESWADRPRSDGQPAGTLMRGGKEVGYVELNDRAHAWIASWPLEVRLRRALRLRPILECAAAWLGGH